MLARELNLKKNYTLTASCLQVPHSINMGPHLAFPQYVPHVEQLKHTGLGDAAQSTAAGGWGRGPTGARGGAARGAVAAPPPGPRARAVRPCYAVAASPAVTYAGCRGVWICGGAIRACN